jgi:hypothetical protein
MGKNTPTGEELFIFFTDEEKNAIFKLMFQTPFPEPSFFPETCLSYETGLVNGELFQPISVSHGSNLLLSNLMIVHI